MKLQVLAAVLLAGALLGGCGGGVSQEQVEAGVLQMCNEQLRSTGHTCISVETVQKSENQYAGVVKCSDGSQRGVTATADPKTGKVLVEWDTSTEMTPR